MQTLDKPFRDLTKAAFARYGFAYGELLSQWMAIAGDEIGGACRPERITWPRQAGESQRRQGGTLILRAAPGRALELHYEIPRLIERINAFYGYGAVGAIRVRQAPVAAGKAALELRPAPDALQIAALDTALARIDDEALRAALRRLGAGALAWCKSSQQDQ